VNVRLDVEASFYIIVILADHHTVDSFEFNFEIILANYFIWDLFDKCKL